MAQPSQLAQLTARRDQLVSESSLLRLRLAQEFLDLQSSATWLERGYTLIRSTSTIWPLLAGLAGILTAGGWLSKGIRFLSLGRFAKMFFGF